MRSRKGFSLIEMLAATVILGILITVVLAPLTRLFENTRGNGQTLRVTTQAQQLTEYVRGQWQSYPIVMITDPADSSKQIDQNKAKRTDSRNRYDRTCSVALPQLTGVTKTVVVRALDRNAAAGSTLTFSENCTAATLSTSPPPMKRVTVTTTTADGESSSLTIDIPRPQNENP